MEYGWRKNHWSNSGTSERGTDAWSTILQTKTKKKNLHQFVISNDGIAAIASSAAAAATNEPIT